MLLSRVAGLLRVSPRSLAAMTLVGSVHTGGSPARNVHHVGESAATRSALAAHKSIPLFSRQTTLACNACHYSFPQLTPFGRQFKLNGYTLTGLQTIGLPSDTGGRQSLKLAPIPGVSAMILTSFTSVAKAVSGTQNNTVAFPDQLSLFVGGEITPEIGAFAQFTYAAADGSIGIDNVDVRYAKQVQLFGRGTVLGLTLNNNPSVQDVWNTTPAWSYPFAGSGVAPSPMAGPVLAGALGQQVVGLGAYSMWNDLIYSEFSVYRSAQQGAAMPLDSTATNVVRALAPYWRVALQHETADSLYFMVGTYGLASRLYPTGVTGLTNRFTDIGLDAQVEHHMGEGAVIGRAAWIHESQNREADFAAGASQNQNTTLSTFNASISYAASLRYGLAGGYFQTSGSADNVVYAPGATTGSATGRPNSQGLMGEATFNPWLNTRLGIQYVAYQKFNGASRLYDGVRDASANNTLFLYFWTAF